MKLIWFNHLFICQILFRYILTESETPALHIQLNPPEQNTKDIIDALKDLERIEMELNQGINEDFEYEKSKLIEIQKARIHDIVHGSFISLQALIPNPIKSEIRQTIRNKLINKDQPSYESENNNYDTKRSENAVKPDDTQREINKIKQNLFLSSPSFKQQQQQQQSNTLINNPNSNNIYNNINELNTELYQINTPISTPL